MISLHIYRVHDKREQNLSSLTPPYLSYLSAHRDPLPTCSAAENLKCSGYLKNFG